MARQCRASLSSKCIRRELHFNLVFNEDYQAISWKFITDFIFESSKIIKCLPFQYHDSPSKIIFKLASTRSEQVCVHPNSYYTTQVTN
jgi:hypothetical protein